MCCLSFKRGFLYTFEPFMLLYAYEDFHDHLFIYCRKILMRGVWNK